MYSRIEMTAKRIEVFFNTAEERDRMVSELKAANNGKLTRDCGLSYLYITPGESCVEFHDDHYGPLHATSYWIEIRYFLSINDVTNAIEIDNKIMEIILKYETEG